MTMTRKNLTGRDIDAMTPAEKNALAQQYERTTPEQRRAAARLPTAAEVEAGKRLARRMPGRPRIGQGAKAVTVTVEIKLLQRADAYAKRHGIKRSEFFSQAISAALGRLG